MKYLNNENEQYVLSFLNEKSNILNTVFDYKTKISVNENIAIITNLKPDTLFIKQLVYNNIHYYLISNIEEISRCLKEIKENYILTVFNTDALIVKDLDVDFITKFDKLNINYLFASTEACYPLPIELNNIRISLTPSMNKYTNCYLCLGYKEFIAGIYKSIMDNNLHFGNKFMDYHKNLIYGSFKNYTIDFYNMFFTTIIPQVNKIKQKDNIRYIIRSNDFNIPNLII